MPESDTERTAVKTYVPEYQKEEWEEHAEELDMSRSEFVRTMVQAGRRGFLDDSTADETDDSLATGVVTALRERGPLSWDELRSQLTEDVETRLDDALETLQSENRVQYSGRDGGYTLTDER